MLIKTQSMGAVDIDPQRVIEFSKGLIGMPDCKRWALLAPVQDSFFMWLQSLDRPELMFVVTDPSRYEAKYQVKISQEKMKELQLTDLSQATVLVIVNQQGCYLTGNLQGPLVINSTKFVGEQIALPAGSYSTRHTLLELRHVPQSMAA